MCAYLSVVSLFHYSSLVQYDNLVGIHHRGQAVCDDYGRSISTKGLEMPHDFCLGLEKSRTYEFI